MRAILGFAVLALLMAVPVQAGKILTACEADTTDSAAIAVDNVPRTRVSHEAADGWYYITPSGTPTDPHHWQETNDWSGLQKGVRWCFEYSVTGNSYQYIRKYVQYMADTPLH